MATSATAPSLLIWEELPTLDAFLEEYRTYCDTHGYATQAAYEDLHDIVDFLVEAAVSAPHGSFAKWPAQMKDARRLYKYGFHFWIKESGMSDESLDVGHEYFWRHAERLPGLRHAE